MDTAQSFHYKRVAETARASQREKRSANSATASPHRRHASESVQSIMSGEGGLEMTHSRTSSMSTTGAAHGGVRFFHTEFAAAVFSLNHLLIHEFYLLLCSQCSLMSVECDLVLYTPS